MASSEADSGSGASGGRRKSSSKERKRGGSGSPCKVPLVVEDEATFKDVQKRRIKVMEKRLDDDLKRKRKDFDREVDRMRSDFLHLYPDDKDWDNEELLSDPMVLRRQGSMDILDQKSVTSLVSEFFEVTGSTRFKLIFNVSEFDQDSVHVQIQSDLVKVTAHKTINHPDGSTSKKTYSRNVQRPTEISATRFETALTQDGILVVEAPIPHSSSLHLQYMSQNSSGSTNRINAPHRPSSSPSHSVHSNSSTRSQSPTSPQTPTGQPKIGMPVFTGQPNDRRLSLVLDMGSDVFKPHDILVSVCNSACLEVKAKTESRNSERSSKNKYYRQVELSEKIISTSLRAGLMNDGKLVIGALGKPEKGPDGKPIQVPVEEGGSGTDSVVDLAADFSRVMNPAPPPKDDEF